MNECEPYVIDKWIEAQLYTLTTCRLAYKRHRRIIQSSGFEYPS
jgi:hypothetical protein